MRRLCVQCGRPGTSGCPANGARVSTGRPRISGPARRGRSTTTRRLDRLNGRSVPAGDAADEQPVGRVHGEVVARVGTPFRQRYDTGLDEAEIAEVVDDLVLGAPPAGAKLLVEDLLAHVGARGVLGVRGARVGEVRDGQVAAGTHRRAEPIGDTGRVVVVVDVM